MVGDVAIGAHAAEASRGIPNRVGVDLWYVAAAAVAAQSSAGNAAARTGPAFDDLCLSLGGPGHASVGSFCGAGRQLPSLSVGLFGARRIELSTYVLADRCRDDLDDTRVITVPKYVQIYFGGYSAKMQDTGSKELERLREAMGRKVAGSQQSLAPKAFQDYSRRLGKYLEAKGIIRTAVETLNLATHAADADATSAECMRTFATVTFPATLLLKREEIETLQIAGQSIIAAVHRGTGDGRNTFMEALFDLMYGFRGNSYVVDLFSPFEMLRYWRMEKILPPKAGEETPTSSWTPEGLKYKA